MDGHADADGHYTTAKDLHKQANDLWTSGKQREGFLKNHEALQEFDQAILAAWPAGW